MRRIEPHTMDADQTERLVPRAQSLAGDGISRRFQTDASHFDDDHRDIVDDRGVGHGRSFCRPSRRFFMDDVVASFVFLPTRV